MCREMYRFFYQYLIFIIAFIGLGIILFIFMQHTFYDLEFNQNIILTPFKDFGYALSIIKNNFQNFLQYVFLFFISPILILIELVILVYQLWLSVTYIGISETVGKLIKHALVEIPTMTLYMFLSLKCCMRFYENLSFKEIIQFAIEYKVYYGFICIGIVVGGLVEGLL